MDQEQEQEQKQETEQEQETYEEEKTIPPYKDLKFKSPGNEGIILTILIRDFGKSFEYGLSYNNALIPGNYPLNSKWYNSIKEMGSISKQIIKILKTLKLSIKPHKEGLDLEIIEFAGKEIIPLIPLPSPEGRYVFSQGNGIIQMVFNGNDKTSCDVIGNFNFNIDTHVINIDTNEIEYQGTISTGISHHREERPFIVNGETLSDKKKFALALNNCGLKVEFNPKFVGDIIQAFQHFVSIKDDMKTILKTSKIGWHEYEDGRNGSTEYFLTKTIKIDYNGIHKNEDVVVEIPDKIAKFIDLDIISDDEFNKCGIHIINELMKLHDPYFMRVSIAKAFGAPHLREIAKHSDEAKYNTEFIGGPQIGKSLVMRLMQRFFGHFPYDDNGYITFGGTVNSIYVSAQYFHDIVLLLDDLKRSQLSNEKYMIQVSDMIHNYTSGTGRMRFEKSSPPMQGSMLITSEGKTSSDEGNASRTLTVIVPKVEKSFELRDNCLKNSDLYPGFMGRFILWSIQNNNFDTKKMLSEYKNNFFEQFKKIENVDPTRFANMYAITLLEYQRFMAFMADQKFISAEDCNKEISEFTEMLIKNGKESVVMLADNDPINLFITTIISIISSGGAIIIDEKDIKPEEKNKPVIGRIIGNVLYLIPDISTEQVNYKLRGYNIRLEKNSLTKGFIERHMLIEKNKDSSFKTIKIWKQSVGCWACDKTVFGYENNLTVDIKKSIPISILSAINKSGINEKPTLSATQYENIKTSVYEDLKFKESDIRTYADMIDTALSSFYLAKGWSKVITLGIG